MGKHPSWEQFQEFRIKEGTIYKDGSSTWFYPQMCVITGGFRGILWWRQVRMRWSCFYMDKDTEHQWRAEKLGYALSDKDERNRCNRVVAFQSLQEARDFIAMFRTYLKERQKAHADDKVKEEREKGKKHIEYVKGVSSYSGTNIIHEA